MQSADYQLTCDKKQISPKHNVFAKMDRLQGTLNADSSTVAEGVQCSTMQVLRVCALKVHTVRTSNPSTIPARGMCSATCACLTTPGPQAGPQPCPCLAPRSCTCSPGATATSSGGAGCFRRVGELLHPVCTQQMSTSRLGNQHCWAEL